MLLANMSVAALIADAFPERSLLRRHPPPNQRKLDEVSHLSNSLVRTPSTGAALAWAAEAPMFLARLRLADMNNKYFHTTHEWCACRATCVSPGSHVYGSAGQ